jgi:hypothetical protein
MSAITVTDIPTNRTLDSRAMSSIRGAKAGEWTCGWITPFAPKQPSPFGNFYQFIYVQTLQVIDIKNSGANSNITAVAISLPTSP